MEEVGTESVCAQLVVSAQQLLCARCMLAHAHHAPGQRHPGTFKACSDSQDSVCLEVLSAEGAHACAQLR